MLQSVRFLIADLEGSLLGLAAAGTIYLDRDAAGAGWFIDPTPAADEEFVANEETGDLAAGAGSPALGRVDLLTVLRHELGHLLGLDHLEQAGPLMGESLAPGVRRSSIARR